MGHISILNGEYFVPTKTGCGLLLFVTTNDVRCR